MTCTIPGTAAYIFHKIVVVKEGIMNWQHHQQSKPDLHSNTAGLNGKWAWKKSNQFFTTVKWRKGIHDAIPELNALVFAVRISKPANKSLLCTLITLNLYAWRSVILHQSVRAPLSEVTHKHRQAKYRASTTVRAERTDSITTGGRSSDRQL